MAAPIAIGITIPVVPVVPEAEEAAAPEEEPLAAVPVDAPEVESVEVVAPLVLAPAHPLVTNGGRQVITDDDVSVLAPDVLLSVTDAIGVSPMTSIFFTV
jgi:hypothetical protein